MKYDEHDDPVATRSASPSAAADARISEPLLPTTPAPARLGATNRFRDPERYQIINEHGRGGLGRVSRARDRDLGRDVAIKELISRGDLSEIRFVREALITARLEHPGIVPVHEAGRWPDGTPFYAMKLVAGRPLRDLIAERTTVEERLGLLHHVIAVADAIAYAHDRNIIHRDLKPSNVIVGDFGETIVIDWGLAKDLSSAAEDAPLEGGPFRTNRNDDLTATGSVLGTPTYMAPEQERGEHVDQRADVFAIGAMLWELCSLQKVPPTEQSLRHRMLRRAGIDQDLITIIDKALEPDVSRRYPDAGAFAADLKAFKSGARIAARRYSLWALLAHWTRRHRALALSSVVAITLGLSGGALYLRNIAAERDRADAALTKAQATANALFLEQSELKLKHAELLLATDPTATVDSLTAYGGSDRDRENQLRAEALARGVAVLRALPHTDSILWIQGIPTGEIVSLSVDGTVSRTSNDGTSTVLANDVAPRAGFSYSPSRYLLAYFCNLSSLCILDVLHNRRVPIPQTFRSSSLVQVAFSPEGSRLALISRSGDLRILDISNLNALAERLHLDTRDGGAVIFIDENTIAVGTANGLKVVYITGSIQVLTDPDGTLWDASPAEHRLVIATARGQAYFVDIAPLRVTTRTTLCYDVISGLKMVPGRHAVAFSCKDGTLGIWELQSNTVVPRAHLEGHPSMIAVSADGNYLAAAGDNGTMTAIDLTTGLITSFRGHGFRLAAITPPTTDYPLFLSADVHGGIRSWPLLGRSAAVIGSTGSRVYSAVFSTQADITIANTGSSRLTTISAENDVRSVGPHADDTASIELSSDGRYFVTYGNNDSLELWLSATMSRLRVFKVDHGSVSHVAFIGNSEDFLSSGRDGRLVRWSSDGKQSIVYQFNQPITTFVWSGSRNSVVLSTQDDRLWRVGIDDSVAHLVANGNTRVIRLMVLDNGVSIFVGYANGKASIIDTSSWQETSLFQASAAIRDVATTADGHTIAVVSNDSIVRIATRSSLQASWRGARFDSMALTASARKIALTPNGLLVAICSNGTVWTYSIRGHEWRCFLTGTTDLTHIVLAGNDNRAVIFDADGRVVSIELAATTSTRREN